MLHTSRELRIADLRKSYGQTTALDDLTVEVGAGELLALLGPSGCGKTTALRIIAGLLSPDSGQIRLGEIDLTGVPPNKRNFGLVFQSYALFPHLTVQENIAYGLRRRGLPKHEIRRTVDRYLELVRLPQLESRYPSELSGGQQQRVALARALAIEPQVLLLDEPLSNLDALLRDQMRVELRRIQQTLGITTILVTHDQTEALTMSDRICILLNGRMQQIGTGDEIYHSPANAFVAQFIARSNVLRGKVEAIAGDQIVIDLGLPQKLRATCRVRGLVGRDVRVIIRHSALLVNRNRGPNARTGRLVYVAAAGATAQFAVQLDEAGAGLELLGEAPREAFPATLRAGDIVSVDVEPDKVVVTRD